MNILVVVDMQNDFIDGSLGTKEAQSIVPKVLEKIQNFDGMVFATRDTHGEDYLDTAEGRKLPVRHCIRETDGWQIRQEIAELLTEPPIDKVTFGSRELVKKLEEIHERDSDRKHYADWSLHRYLCDFQRPALQSVFAGSSGTGGRTVLCRSDCRKSYAGVGGNEDVSDRHSIEETGMKKRVQKDG